MSLFALLLYLIQNLKVIHRIDKEHTDEAKLRFINSY